MHLYKYEIVGDWRQYASCNCRGKPLSAETSYSSWNNPISIDFAMHPLAAYHSLCLTLLSSRSSSTKSCPLLMFVLTLSLTLLLISSCVGLDTNITIYSDHYLNKRSYYDLQCNGIYDRVIFAKVDQICEDCYNIFREPKLHVLCRQKCFTSDYFKGCVEILRLDNFDKIQVWITRLNGLGV